MSKSWSVGLVAEVNAEVVVHLHAPILRVNVNDEHHRALGNVKVPTVIVSMLVSR